MTAGRWRRVVAGCVVGAAAVGCGIGADESPRALEVTVTTTTAPPGPTAGFASALLYFVREGSLLPIEQELPDDSPSTILEALVQAAPQDQAVSNLATSIPAGTEVLSFRRDDTHATVDLSEEFDNVVGLSRQQAIAQMVMTLTGREGLDTVSFQVEGSDIAVASTTRGDVDEVDACDYVSLLSDADSAIRAGLPGPALLELSQRRAELEQQCSTTAVPG